MKSVIIALSLCLSCFCMAQAPLGGTPVKPAADNANKQDKKPAIRFVLRNQEGSLNEDAYLLVDDKKSVKVDLRLGLPGRRVAIPKTNRIRIFTQEPTPDLIKKGIKPILDAPIPAGMGIKTIGIIGYDIKTKGYDIQFLDETGIKPGLVYFVNLTNKDYLVDVPKAPGSETKRFNLKAGSQYVFGKSLVGDIPGTIPFRIYHQVPVQGQPQWILERRSLMGMGKTRSSILALMPDSSGTSMILHEMMVYQEK